jgi:LAS superfamily LD-carboxypeptidase LdcB
MKKVLFLLFLAVPVILAGCGNVPQIQPVQNLTELQTEITRISDELLSGTITPEAAQELFEQLQSKYTELTEAQLLSRMNALKEIIDQQKDASVKLGTLPTWAKDL